MWLGTMWLSFIYVELTDRWQFSYHIEQILIPMSSNGRTAFKWNGKGKRGNLENDAKLLFSMELQQVRNLSYGVSKKSKVESQNYIISILPV
jgi:hypothetical protein